VGKILWNADIRKGPGLGEGEGKLLQNDSTRNVGKGLASARRKPEEKE